jgi:cell wall-associated NlpC family hydrolase
MQGVVDKIFPPDVPRYADCSSFATWTYFVGGARDPNGLAYSGYGYTGTLAQHGWRVGTTRAQDVARARPGDLVFYGRGRPWDHVAVYVGGGLVVGHGSESGPNRLRIDYRSDRGEIRSYF